MTFADLQEKPEVSAEELLATLAEYVSSGAGVKGRVVNEIISRTNLIPAQREELRQIAERGRESQKNRGFRGDAAEYGEIVSSIRRFQVMNRR